jgi:anti-sigma factor RsiW
VDDSPDIKHDRQFLTELSAYLDGDVPDELRLLIEQHLARCSDCRVVVDTLRQTVTLYERLPAPRLSARARERLYQSLSLEKFLPRDGRA